MLCVCEDEHYKSLEPNIIPTPSYLIIIESENTTIPLPSFLNNFGLMLPPFFFQ